MVEYVHLDKLGKIRFLDKIAYSFLIKASRWMVLFFCSPSAHCWWFAMIKYQPNEDEVLGIHILKLKLSVVRTVLNQHLFSLTLILDM
jgi:hypothetical protein